MKPFGRRAEAPPVPADEPTPAVPVREAPREAPLFRLRSQVMDRVDPAVAAELPAAALRAQLEAIVHEVAGRQRLELSAREQARLAEELTHDMVGYGPLEPLLQDDSISDIMVNGPDRVFIEVRGRMRLSDVRFRDAAQVANIAQKMAAAVGRRVDESSPLLDCRLADGSRVNVVFPPLALDGPCLSIRKFSKKKIDFSVMVANGSMIPQVARVLEIAARCRLNTVVSGGTGSGKTTMMNALSRLIDHEERIVTIEDAAELQLQQPHVVRLETRPPNLEGKGEITQRDLMKNALRMRPDRIIVGEVRGSEAFDMLQAMNTGHDGSICTVHANTTRDAVTRIENMVQMGSMSLPPRAIRTQIASAVDLIIQVERMRDGVRRVSQISEICGLEGDVITMNEVFTYNFEGEDANGQLLGQYTSPRTRPGFSEKLRYYGLERSWMDALQELPE
ncbi:CpaF family protein [Pseudoroseomonas wenyumeiae]|uniref:CpaF family protein n=1 Tax=Teichococcus wenyumeiae TaxID=2478470 RepID=A0A3A9J7J3_9PROT|nr:CpaF family protein [Pseudoroseomonas wenyumeiae]RKK03197.1 CpaF family protein [Pseudoroseomonas wenyumeiae]RMI15546.1 CpaF family protein [Pseudoroseomonas wenyumeiae]